MVALAASGALAVMLSVPLAYATVTGQRLLDAPVAVGAASVKPQTTTAPSTSYNNGAATAPTRTTATAPARASATPPARASATPPAPSVVPRRVIAPVIGLDAIVEPYTEEMVRDQNGSVRPARVDRVAWWSGGGTPSVRADNTVYLYGHTWNRPAVFNDIGHLQPGDEVVVRGDRGEVRYGVTGQYVVDKDDLAADPRVRAAVPGRLLLIGCYRQTGLERYTTHNIVVQAQLLDT